MKTSENIYNISVEAYVIKSSNGNYNELIGQNITATKFFKDGDKKFIIYGRGKKAKLILFDDLEFSKIEDVNVADVRGKTIITDSENVELLEKIKSELKEYFSKNTVSNKTIEEFDVVHSYPHTIYNIIPRVPVFDENYNDHKADEDIALIGQKYNIKLSWIYWVYPK